MSKPNQRDPFAVGAEVRIRALKRDRYKCTYCGVSGTDAELEIDHIIPVSQGGSHHVSNLTTACRSCNQKKSDGTLAANESTRDRSIASGLIGLFLHVFDNGEVIRQGKVIGLDVDVVLVETYSWWDGLPTRVEPYARSKIYSDACRLYSSAEMMRDALDRMERGKWHKDSGS